MVQDSPYSFEPAENDIRIPEKADLWDALEKILWFWPNVYIRSFELDPSRKMEFNLTRAVKLSGQHQGLVLIQSSEALGMLLASSLQQTGTHASRDAFNEFVNMFCGHIMNKIRNSDRVAFRHFLPFELSPQAWPARSPEAMMTVAIQDIPLNVLLWIDPVPTPSEKVV